jgi:hypothetical protein
MRSAAGAETFSSQAKPSLLRDTGGTRQNKSLFPKGLMTAPSERQNRRPRGSEPGNKAGALPPVLERIKGMKDPRTPYFDPPDKRTAVYQTVTTPTVKQEVILGKQFAFNDPNDSSERGTKDACVESGVKSPHEKNSAFEKDLAEVINRHSRENGSNTPDFILAAYLADCLENFDRILAWRQKWYSPEGVPAAERIHGPKI